MDAHTYATSAAALRSVLTLAPKLPHFVETAVYDAKAYCAANYPDGVGQKLLPELVRAKLCAALQLEGVVDPDDTDPADRNSVYFVVDHEQNVSLRVMKKPDGSCSAQPGSRRRGRECAENLLLFGDDVAPSRITLQWTWHVNTRGEVVQYLLLPAAPGERAALGGHHWRLQVPDQLADLSSGLHTIDPQDSVDDLEEFSIRDDIAGDGDDDGPELA